jgi:hypothetical protein
VFLVGLGGTARDRLARRHAHTRIRLPHVRCRSCSAPERFTLPRRW